MEALAKQVTALAQTALDVSEGLDEDGTPDEARHARVAARYLQKAAEALGKAGV